MQIAAQKHNLLALRSARPSLRFGELHYLLERGGQRPVLVSPLAEKGRAAPWTPLERERTGGSFFNHLLCFRLSLRSLFLCLPFDKKLKKARFFSIFPVFSFESESWYSLSFLASGLTSTSTYTSRDIPTPRERNTLQARDGSISVDDSQTGPYRATQP